METEQRFIIILTLLGVILLSIVALVLFVALWPYRLIIGCVLVVLVVLVFLLVCGITVNEQVLRHKRVKYHSELPLDGTGHPLYLYQNMKRSQEEPRYD
jgi:cell division protein FtsW (lipid II flippase)